MLSDVSTPINTTPTFFGSKTENDAYLDCGMSFTSLSIILFESLMELKRVLLVGNRRDTGRPKNEYPLALNALDI